MTTPATDRPRRKGTRWTRALTAPFDESQIAQRPSPSCRACAEHADRVCNDHRKIDCPTCGLYITEAHNDLDYVGHADVTQRLNEVDPRWSWEPAYRDVDKEIMLAAIATGNPEIVQLVIGNSPPLLDRSGGMWMTMILHDDEGEEVRRPAYGDAGSKSGPNAVKERIGDGIRNGAMRFGVATDLWSKTEREQTRNGAPSQDGRRLTPARPIPAPAPLDEDAPAALDETPADPEPVSAAGAVTAQALATLAWQLATRDDSTVDQLRAQVQEIAERRQLLGAAVPDERFRDGTEITLADVIAHAKRAIVQRAAA